MTRDHNTINQLIEAATDSIVIDLIETTSRANWHTYMKINYYCISREWNTRSQKNLCFELLKAIEKLTSSKGREYTMLSFLMLNQLRCCRSRFVLKNGYGPTAATSMMQRLPYCSNHNEGGNGHGIMDGEKAMSTEKKRTSALGQTVTLVQQGNEIQELPMSVRRYGLNDVIASCSNENQINNRQMVSRNRKDNQTTNSVSLDTSQTMEERASIELTNRLVYNLEECQTGNCVLSYIDEMTEFELQQRPVLFTAVFQILVFEPIKGLMELDKNEKFQHLIDLYCKHCYAMQSLSLMVMLLEQRPFMHHTINRACDELLLRNSQADMTITETCESIAHFVHLERFDGAEKFWSGIADQEATIDKKNIRFVFLALPKLKVSRRAVVKILDRVVEDIFPFLKVEDVCDVLEALSKCPHDHTKTMRKSIACWLDANIHAVRERELETIVHCLTALPFSDPMIERALERYMKAKAAKIRKQMLIVELAKHATVFRLLNVHILNGCSEFFIANAAMIDPGNVRDILRPFGVLHYQPLNSTAFWKSIERYLDVNFDRIPPAHVVDIMLIAIILEMFPVNFVERIFNRYFMQTIHSALPIERLPGMRFNLKLIDTAMTLECSTYHGPILPKERCDARLSADNRIKCVINDNIDVIAKIAGGKNAFTKFTVPDSLPYNDFYVIDILFHPAGLTSQLWRYYYNKSVLDRNVYVAVLVHLPEHYESSQQYLIGAQKMRIRHLRRIGLKVVSLNYERLTRLGMHKEELRQYIVDQMKDALPALEPIDRDQ